MNEQVSKNADKILGKLYVYVSPKFKQFSTNRILETIIENTKNFSMTRTLLHKDSVPFSKIYEHPDFTYNGTIVQDINDLLKTNSKVTLIAKGGSGKTTFLKKLYIDCFDEFDKIPLILNLREFNNIDVKRDVNESSINNNYIFKILVNQLVESKISIDSKIAEKMFQSGRFFILFDGFDEINIKKQSILTNDLINFVNRFNENKYIVTTRPYTTATNLLGFENVSLEGLKTFEKKSSFIRKQLFNNLTLADNVIRSLTDKDALKYLELLENPLFLILFLNSYESYPKIPLRKTDFYLQVFDALYEKHDSFSKLGYTRPKFTDISKEHFKNVLEGFCCVSYFQSKFSFKQHEINIILSNIKKSIDCEFELSDYVNDLKISIPLLIEDGQELTFIHRSIQEYFTALYVNNLIVAENYEFLKELAEDQNEKRGNHTFILELISELHPMVFRKYYIPYHLEYFFLYFKNYLEDQTIKNSYDRVYNFYNEFKVILSYCSELKKPFDEFVKNNTIPDGNINLLLGANTKEEIKLSEEILILYKNRKKFYSEINSILKAKEESTNNLWRYAFSKR